MTASATRGWVGSSRTGSINGRRAEPSAVNRVRATREPSARRGSGVRLRGTTEATGRAPKSTMTGIGTAIWSEALLIFKKAESTMEVRGVVVYQEATQALPDRQRVGGWPGVALAVALACAAVLVLAIVAPRELARTSWGELRGGGGYIFNDSPAGYVGQMTLGGLAAGLALTVGALARRWRVGSACAVVAAFAFAGAAFWAARYRMLLSQGVMGLEGRLDTSGAAGMPIDPPELLPVFLVVAVVGALAALALAVAWWPRRAERGRG